MTGHLPECLALLDDSTWDGGCICKAILACEERVLEANAVSHAGKRAGLGNAAWDGGYNAGRRDERAELSDPGTALARVSYDKGYAEALAAAREAVDTQSRKRGGSDGSPAMYAWVPALFAAIDALKEGR